MAERFTVDFACNDGRNGAFLGTFDGVEIENRDGSSLSMNVLCIDEDDFGATIKFEENVVIIDGVPYPKSGHTSGKGNWCWDSVSMVRSDVEKLAHHLARLGFGVDQWDDEFQGLVDELNQSNSATPPHPVVASPSVPDAANTESSGAETLEVSK